MGYPQTFTAHDLDAHHQIFASHLPAELVPDGSVFETLWSLHPTEFWEIQMHGRPVRTPRWQQAYNKDYAYSGKINHALPVPSQMAPYLAWAQDAVDARLNGLLLNWYDGALGHYIGKHRDSIKGLVAGTPIVTISFGELRHFRMRPWRGQGFVDFPVPHGAVLIIPYDTNLAWTHEVPDSASTNGRRISLTMRAFV